MDLFKVYCIGRQFMTEDSAVMISFSSVWNLLYFWRSVSSDYSTQIVMDVTHKCSTATVNKHGIRVNMLCRKAAPLSFTLIPAQIESEPVHTKAYHAMLRALQNKSLEAVWRWDRHACTSGSQAISPILYTGIAHLIFYIPHPIFYIPYPKFYIPYPKFYVPYPKFYVPYPKF